MDEDQEWFVFDPKAVESIDPEDMDGFVDALEKMKPYKPE